MKYFKTLSHILLLFALIIGAVCYTPTKGLAQNPNVWSGLKEPQSILPVGNAPVSKTVRKQYVDTPSTLQKIGECEWIIAEGWRLIAGNISDTGVFGTSNGDNSKTMVRKSFDGAVFNATVPGIVLTTLIEQGVYPDPYFGLNNMSIPDELSRMDWWYEVDFSIPENITLPLSGHRYHLLFNGINYRSEIFLNGVLIGKTDGAFCRGNFDITDIVLQSLTLVIPENKILNSAYGDSAERPVQAGCDSLKLRVHVFPPEHPGIPHEQSMSEGQGLNGGATSLDGPTFIASVGWDWMPGIRDRNTGIWQPVSLIVTGDVTIDDPMIITDLPLPDTSFSAIRIETAVHNKSYSAVKGVLKAALSYAGNAPGKYNAVGQDVVVEIPFDLAPLESRKMTFSPENHPQLLIRNPWLWWPNGYGEQNLYELVLSVQEESKYSVTGLSDLKKVLFGIRELSYELMAHDSADGAVRIEWDPTDRYVQVVNHIRPNIYEHCPAGRSAQPSPQTLPQTSPQLSEQPQSQSSPQPSEQPQPQSQPFLAPMFDNEMRVLFSKERNIYIPSFAGSDRRGIQHLPHNDPVGPFLVIKVNGMRIFCRGGNWGMDDALKRTSRERLEPAFQLHRNLNFNIIRNWTGETTQEIFYQLCDEYGMLVWNDFWMTGDDTVEPLDHNLFLANATDVVRRFRNHPSIAIWGPRNEGFAPAGLENSLSKMIAREDPTRHYHGQSRFLNMGTSGPWNYFEDPSHYFTERADGFNTEMGSFAIPTAQTINKFISPEDLWPINDVWAYHDLHHTSQNFEGFIKAVQLAGGFGQSSSNTDFTAAPDVNICSAANCTHNANSCKSSNYNRITIHETLSREKMTLFADASQSICYDAWRAMIESWNSRMWNNTTGLILWMSHPAWPSFIWQTYTYDFETPGSYFGAKKGAEPVHIQLNPDGADGTVSIINTTLQTLENLKVYATIYSPSGRLIMRIATDENITAGAEYERRYARSGNSKHESMYVKSSSSGYSDWHARGEKSGKRGDSRERAEFSAQANCQTICFPLTISSDVRATLPESYLIRLELFDNDDNVLSVNDYWKGVPLPPQDLNGLIQISQPRQIGSSHGRANGSNSYEIAVTNTSDDVIARGIKIIATNSATGEQILPLLISDGYFNLLPGEKRVLVIDNIPDTTIKLSHQYIDRHRQLQ